MCTKENHYFVLVIGRLQVHENEHMDNILQQWLISSQLVIFYLILNYLQFIGSFIYSYLVPWLYTASPKKKKRK